MQDRSSRSMVLFLIENDYLFILVAQQTTNKRLQIITFLEEKTIWWTTLLIYHLGQVY